MTYILFLMFIYYFERERETERETEYEWGRERGRHRIWSRLKTLSCQHRARHGAWIHRPQDHDLSWSQTLNRLSHPGTPILFLTIVFFMCANQNFQSPDSPFPKHFLLKLLPIAGSLCIVIFILPCLCGNPGKPSKVSWKKIINRGVCLDSTCGIA